jgi:hypothetical protein
MKDLLRVLFTPSCWMQNEPYSEQWDIKLNKLMECYSFTDVTKHTAKLGNFNLWIENYPYASFVPYPFINVRPRRITVLKAHDKLVFEQLLERERSNHE